MDRVFLDANVLFSASHKHDSPFRKLWGMRDISLLTSNYAILETKGNTRGIQQSESLDGLLKHVEVVAPPSASDLPGIMLPEKDRPILTAAIAASATHLLTGDKAHFGPYYGQRVQGVLILRPAEYIRGKAK